MAKHKLPIGPDGPRWRCPVHGLVEDPVILDEYALGGDEVATYCPFLGETEAEDCGERVELVETARTVSRAGRRSVVLGERIAAQLADEIWREMWSG